MLKVDSRTLNLEEELRDESLHRRINSFMKYSKIGMELAYALLMSLFDTINEERKIPSVRKSILQYVAEHTICYPQKRLQPHQNLD